MKHILEGNHLGFFKFIIHIFIFCNNHVRVLLRKYLSLIHIFGYLTESLHGAGSPQAQRVVISRQSNMPGKKEMAKAIVHIED